MGYSDFKTLYNDVISCTKCGLCETRTNTVFGEGNLKADLMFIGEAPGAAEDIQGRPFVGRAGKLLDKLLSEIGLNRSEVYIANVLKCRPPNNRDPNEDEQAACIDYLRAQIAFIKPKIIVCLGRIASGTVLKRPIRIVSEHGKLFDVKNFTIVPTYHPAALLRNEGLIVEVRKDFALVKQRLLKQP